MPAAAAYKVDTPLREIASWSAQYAAVQISVVVAAACIVAYTGSPPWALLYNGSWTHLIARTALWATLCSGLGDLLNGDTTSDYKDKRSLAAFLTVWLMAALAQIVCLSVPAVPPLAALVVAAAAAVATVAVQTAAAHPSQWPDKLSAAVLRSEALIRWGAQGLLAYMSANLQPGLEPRLVLLFAAVAQAVWQMYAWAISAQAGLSNSYGLYVNALTLAHVVSVRVLWLTPSLGFAHASVVAYGLLSVTSVLYEPRLSLPYQTEDVVMRIWSRLNHPQLNPVFTVSPLLASIDVCLRLFLGKQALKVTLPHLFLGLHLILIQVVLYALRTWRYHQEVKQREISRRAVFAALVVDALLWGLLHAVLLTGLPLGALPTYAAMVLRQQNLGFERIWKARFDPFGQWTKEPVQWPMCCKRDQALPV